MLQSSEIEFLQANLDKLSETELAEVLLSLEELEARQQAQRCQDDLIGSADGDGKR